MDFHKYFNYDPLTGEMTHKERTIDMFTREQTMKMWNTRFANKSALNLNKIGYLVVKVNKKDYLAHRVAWEIYYGTAPNGEIDHLDRDPTNNKISNFYLTDRIGNSRNKGKYKTCTSGHTGVSWLKRDNKWEAKITVNYKTIHLGKFVDINDADKARKAAEQLYGFNPNHGN